MPRPKRICVPGIPLHVVQRGNNRQPCFLHRRDYVRYLEFLVDAADRYGCCVHAYALMKNHVHLLVTPGHENGVSKMMQYLGRSYVLSFNRIHRRTGTLWEGRFRSCCITDDHYLFACYRYIEMNPVRADIVQTPDEYAWSSYRANALGVTNSIVKPSKSWIALGTDDELRRRAYRRMFDRPENATLVAEIRATTK